MRRAYFAMKHGNWEDFKEEFWKEGKLCEWTSERICEACEKVAKDDIGRLGIMRKSTDFLRRIIAPVDGMGRSHFVVRLLTLQQFHLDGYIWWVSTGHQDCNRRKKHCNRCCAACGGRSIATGAVLLVEANTNGESPT